MSGASAPRAEPDAARLRVSNRRKCLVLTAVMIGLGAPAGAVVGEAIEIAATQVPRVWPALVGAMVGLLLTALLASWSAFQGAKAVIAVSACHRVRWVDDPDLLAVVDEVRLAMGLHMPRVYVLDDTALNAFSTGRSSQTARLVVTAGLRRTLTRQELRAVVAHELAHVRHGDTLFMLLMCTMVGLLLFVCDWARRIAWGAGRGAKHSTDAAKFSGIAALVWGGCFVVSAALFVIAPALSWLVQAIISREREYLADAGAAAVLGDPGPLMSALRKIAADPDPLVDVANRATAHLFIANPLERMRRSGQSWDSFLCSHPPTEKRLARLAALANVPG